jgi:ABC-type multidrug transport system fused ATPase/permease subunit
LISEHLVQEAIDDMLQRGKKSSDGSAGLTVLIVAHRLSTVRNADKIFVIQDGCVAEEGAHDDLLERNGAYAQLIRRQMDAHDKLENGTS